MEDKKMKHTRLFSLIAAVSLVSCMEEIAVENEMMDGTQQTPDAECPVYTDSITLVAFSGETKTQREGTEITWTEGDRIKVYFDGGSAESLPAVISGEGTTASFTIPLEEPLTEDAKIYAVYPSTASASLEEGTFKVTIPAEQSAVFKNADILAATTTAGAASLHFQHVAGLVSFIVSEGNPKGIQTAVFKDFFRSAGIAGTCPLTFDEEGNMTVGKATDTKSEIVVKDIQAGENYIAIVPGVTMESVGLKLKTAEKALTPKATDNDLVVEAAHIRPMGVVDTSVGDAYYIKAGATGKGTSWDDAAGVSLISELMSTPLPKGDDTYQRRAAAWRLDGQEIRMAEGTYELPGTMNAETGNAFTFQATYLLSKATFSINGGYDENGVESGTAKAVFTGNGKHPIMALWSGVNATISNVIFKDGFNDTYGDSAVNGIGQIGGAIDLDNTSVVTFNNCKFLNNRSTVYTGGAFAITQNGTKATFNSCVFDGNESSKNGGAVFIGNAGATFDNCTFVKNKTTGKGGGAIFFNNDARNNTLTITNSVFGGDNASDGNVATNGGAALLLSNGKKAVIKNTVFKYNSATTRDNGYHGAVAIADATNTDNRYARIHVDFEGCVFLKNTGGGVAVTSCWPTYKADTYNGEYISFDGCRFEENVSEYRGGALWYAGTLPVLMNSCTFKSNSMTGTQAVGSTISMVAITKSTYGMLAMNNCTVSGGMFESSGKKSISGDVYLRGKSIVSNCTLLSDGTVAPLAYCYNANYGDAGGSVLVNNVICSEKIHALDGDSYFYPLFLPYESSGTFTINGYYNLYQERGGGYVQKYSPKDDSMITKAYNDFGFAESNYGTADAPNNLFDYTIPTGSTVTKTPSVDEVATAIKSMSVVRKSGGKTFGNMFYDWLTSIGAADTDARGMKRTSANNRQGALVK